MKLVVRLIVFLALCLSGSPAWASYAFVGTASNFAASGASITVTYSPTAGNTLFIPVWYSSAATKTVSSVTDQSLNPISYTVVGSSVYDGSSEDGLRVLVVNSAPSGVTSIIVTISGSASGGIATGVYEYSGISSTFDPNSTGSTGTTATVSPSGTITIPSITNTAQPAVMWAAVICITHDNRNVTAGTGFTLRAKTQIDSVPGYMGVEDMAITSVAAQPVTFVSSASNTGTDSWAGVAVMINQAGVTPTHTNLFFFSANRPHRKRELSAASYALPERRRLAA